MTGVLFLFEKRNRKTFQTAHTFVWAKFYRRRRAGTFCALPRAGAAPGKRRRCEKIPPRQLRAGVRTLPLPQLPAATALSWRGPALR